MSILCVILTDDEMEVEMGRHPDFWRHHRAHEAGECGSGCMICEEGERESERVDSLPPDAFCPRCGGEVNGKGRGRCRC